MNISITNIVALNGGDAAILLGTIKDIRDVFGENTNIDVFCTYPEICRRLYPEIKWHETLGICADRTKYNHIRYIGKIARLLKRGKFYTLAHLLNIGIDLTGLFLKPEERYAIKIYQKSDIIISTGGTYLIEPYGITTQYIDYKITFALNRKLVFYTQSMGPFNSKEVRRKIGEIFNNKYVRLMLFRDQQSMANAETLLIKNQPKMVVVPDAAFSLGNIEILNESRHCRIGKKKKVAFSVRKWDCFRGKDPHSVMNTYVNSMAVVAIELIKKGYDLFFFSTCQGIKEYDDDSTVVAEIIRNIPFEYRSSITNITNYLTIDEIRSLLGQMDFIIATRLHMSILSLISGTPVYPIAYEFKTVELFHGLGYDHVLFMGEICPDSLVNSVNKFIERYDKEKREHVVNLVSEYISNSKRASHLLKDI